MIQDIAADVHLLLAQYMRALVVLAATAFVAYASFFSAIGVPYGILLAAIAFPLEFIPMVGPLASAVIILMVAGLSGFHHLLWILIFLAVFRVFQDYVLSPHLLSAGTELHPLVVIFGVLTGGQIAGITGSFLSVPVLATLRIVYRQLKEAPRSRAPESADPLPLKRHRIEADETPASAENLRHLSPEDGLRWGTRLRQSIQWLRHGRLFWPSGPARNPRWLFG